MKVKGIEVWLQDYFQDWTKNMVRYGLEAQLGQSYTNEDETAVLYELGDFLFLAGEADPVLLAAYRRDCQPSYRILITEEDGWQKYLANDSSLSLFTRYAFTAEVDFDQETLRHLLEQLLTSFTLEEVNPLLYQELAEADWSKDLRGNFVDFDDFHGAGAFGFVIRKERKIVAGVSTAFVYKQAIEIEIATKPTYQKQGLASVLGAQMTLAALERGVVPLWDAHNEASKKIAERIGYHYSNAYPAYEFIDEEKT